MLIEEKDLKRSKREIPYGVADEVEKDMSSWRSHKPVIDYSKCIKCLTCWMNCPDLAYEVKKEFPVLRTKNCKGCGICAEHCPVKCIKMVRNFHEKKD